MTKPKKLPTQQYLKECFTYEPTSGKLFWNKRPLEHFKDSRVSNIWNSRFAGKIALNCVGSNGYYQGSINGKVFKTHRVIWKLIYGTEPDTILHERGSILDNRIQKLLSGTQAENMKDQKKYLNNDTGVVGVYWNQAANKWQAQIGVNGKLKYLGLFTDLEEAALVRKAAEVKYGFHKDHGRD